MIVLLGGEDNDWKGVRENFLGVKEKFCILTSFGFHNFMHLSKLMMIYFRYVYFILCKFYLGGKRKNHKQVLNSN